MLKPGFIPGFLFVLVVAEVHVLLETVVLTVLLLVKALVVLEPHVKIVVQEIVQAGVITTVLDGYARFRVPLTVNRTVNISAHMFAWDLVDLPVLSCAVWVVQIQTEQTAQVADAFRHVAIIVKTRDAMEIATTHVPVGVVLMIVIVLYHVRVAVEVVVPPELVPRVAGTTAPEHVPDLDPVQAQVAHPDVPAHALARVQELVVAAARDLVDLTVLERVVLLVPAAVLVTLVLEAVELPVTRTVLELVRVLDVATDVPPVYARTCVQPTVLLVVVLTLVLLAVRQRAK